MTNEKISWQMKKSLDKWKNLMKNEKISWQMKKSHDKWKNLMKNEKISWQMKKSDHKWKNLMTNEKQFYDKLVFYQYSIQCVLWTQVGWCKAAYEET